ncbi:hypothetical protein [Marinobacterium aestuarii]|uniref:hypothetical protein n=1 Tax=Marinobacterium aestuarii TaxID=1821621 RepID=UPI000AB43F4A|nr:hypothetical protein [Marinobacterium aestuarii]
MRTTLLGASLIIFVLVAMNLTGSVDLPGQTTQTTQAGDAQTGRNLADCMTALKDLEGGWCELRVSPDNPGIANVWPAKQPRIQHSLGPKAVLTAWSSAAWDSDNKAFYFMGGGGRDYGGNEVYRFSLTDGSWKRLTNPSPLDHWTTVKTRHFWIPDIRSVPPASYIHDGLLFNNTTGTIILLASQPANGAIIRDDDNASQSTFLKDGNEPHQYEFNPSESEVRNGLAPLSWRRIGDYPWSTARSVQLQDGTLILGNKERLYKSSQNKEGQLQDPQLFHDDHKSRGGNAVYDSHRKWIWSLYLRSLVAVDSSGRTMLDINLPMNAGRSIAFDQHGSLVMWDGNTRIFMLDPADSASVWRTINWVKNGPYGGAKGAVYGKWIHLGNNYFAGISSYSHGIWIYKHPDNPKSGRQLSDINIQKMVDQAEDNSALKLPAGLYPYGLRIDKPLTLDLEGVELMDVSGGKGLLNITSTDGSLVRIRNFEGNAEAGAAQTGNLAGIRITGVNFNVSLENITIRKTAIGVMTDNRGGSLSIQDSVFEDIGYYKRKGLSHIIYAGAIDSLDITNSRLQRALHLGHLLKSRAKSTTIKNSQLLGLQSNHSRVIDLSCGGRLLVSNSVLQSSSLTDNQDLISVGVEKPQNCRQGLQDGSIDIKNSVIIFDRDTPAANKNRLFTWRTGLEYLSLNNNTIVSKGDNNLLKQEIGDTAIEIEPQHNTLFKSRQAASLNPIPDTSP